MRTTISIDDHVLESAKRRAVERRTTLGQVIEEALRAALLRPAEAAAPAPFKLVTFRGAGPRPGINLDRSSELLELEDLDHFGPGPAEMMLPDVNVLIYAHREESPEHDAHARWLVSLATGPETFALSELVLAAFVRIVTNARVFPQPTPLPTALAFAGSLLARPACVPLRPGPRHWAMFDRLCRAVKATAKLSADAYHAALAMEHGCEWITTDVDFARFPGLRWRHPLRP